MTFFSDWINRTRWRCWFDRRLGLRIEAIWRGWGVVLTVPAPRVELHLCRPITEADGDALAADADDFWCPDCGELRTRCECDEAPEPIRMREPGLDPAP